jgi:hypothetical protein
VLFALGGTISMAAQDGRGVIARLTGKDLVGSVEALGPSETMSATRRAYPARIRAPL